MKERRLPMRGVAKEHYKLWFNEEPLEIARFESIDFYVLAPVLAFDEIEKVTLDDFPAKYCGAGEGLSERLVPDYLRFFWKKIKISPACRVHDLEYLWAPPTWDAFCAANERLRQNIDSLITQNASRPWVIKTFRFIAMVYLMATSEFGRWIFWEIKRLQGHELPESARWFVSDT